MQSWLRYASSFVLLARLPQHERMNLVLMPHEPLNKAWLSAMTAMLQVVMRVDLLSLLQIVDCKRALTIPAR